MIHRFPLPLGAEHPGRECDTPIPDCFFHTLWKILESNMFYRLAAQRIDIADAIVIARNIKQFPSLSLAPLILPNDNRFALLRLGIVGGWLSTFSPSSLLQVDNNMARQGKTSNIVQISFFIFIC